MMTSAMTLTAATAADKPALLHPETLGSHERERRCSIDTIVTI
jgi:hypothetical protein